MTEDKFIDVLLKRYNYINKKTLDKIMNKILSGRYTNDNFYDYQFMDNIYCILQGMNTAIALKESNQKFRKYKQLFKDNVCVALEKNICFLQHELFQMEKEYKALTGNENASLEQDVIFNNIGVLPEVEGILSTTDSLKQALKVARKQGMELFVKYYKNYEYLQNHENALNIVNALDGVLWGNKFGYFGDEFKDKQAFKVNTDEFLAFESTLENIINDFDIQSVDDPKFEHFKEKYKEYIEYAVKQVPPSDVPSLIENMEEYNKSILSFANSRCDEYCNFANSIAMWIPRALFPMLDGNFVVTRKELEERVNIDALNYLQEEYSVFFNFCKNNGIEMTLTDEINDFALMHLYQSGVNEEDVNEVYKREKDGVSQVIKYDDISKDFFEKVTSGNYDNTYIENEKER